MEAIASYLLMLQKCIKEKYSKIKKNPLCLVNLSGDFSANNMKKNRIKRMRLRFFC